MHTDDSLYHAIIAAHHDRDPKAARHLGLRGSGRMLRQGFSPLPRSGRGSSARLGIVSPIPLDVATPIPRPFAALASLAAAVGRPVAFMRVRSTAPCCAANRG